MNKRNVESFQLEELKGEPEKASLVKNPLYISKQPSINANAKKNWNKIQRYINDKSEAQKSTTDKWVNLTRSMSQNVGQFFGVVVEEEDQPKTREPPSDIWKARSRRLHNNSYLFNRTIIKNKNIPQTVLQIPDSQQSSAFHSLDIDKSVDKSVALQSFPLDKWSQKIPHPIDPLARMHSRQLSCMSTASSKRVMRYQSCKILQKDSVFKMAVTGARRIASEKRINLLDKISVRHKRSFTHAAKMTPIPCLSEETVDEDFFKEARPTSPLPSKGLLHIPTPSYSAFNSLESYDAIDASDFSSLPIDYTSKAIVGHAKSLTQQDYSSLAIDAISMVTDKHGESLTQDEYASLPSFDVPVVRDKHSQPLIQLAHKIPEDLIKNAMETKAESKPKKRKFGIGLVGRWLGNDYKEDAEYGEDIEVATDLTDYRPYFTYWVTFVQIVVYIFAVSVYGISYVGFSRTLVDGEVRRNNLAIEKVHYLEQDNMWIGPRQADLIHLGARYSPCMRRDLNVHENLERDRAKERISGCCLFNDGSGCVQTVEDKCSKTLSSWINSTVCGQDPRYCKSSLLPSSLWSREDITLWPVCKDKVNRTGIGTLPSHISCELIGRPCCIGIHGQCIITTQDHCQFLRGYFHPEYTLCSQVPSCLSEVCGMIAFYDPTTPNQFYRLWTSLFLHAGLVQLLISICFQFFVMRDVEKLLGWHRVAIIYILSGVIGSLASAIFLPYHVEAGPSGSQFAIISCLIVEVMHSWSLLDQPFCALLKQLLIVLLLFVAGLFPWIDNWAHLFGFMVGLLLSLALMPYVASHEGETNRGEVFTPLNSDVNDQFDAVKNGDFGRPGRSKRGGKCRPYLRVIIVVSCLLAVGGLLAMVIILFYVQPIYSCDTCHYFNCIPFTTEFCRAVEIRVEFIEDL